MHLGLSQNSFIIAALLDTELVAPGTEIVCLAKTPGVLVIASGDMDLLPLVNVAKEHRWRVEMYAFRSTFVLPDSELCNAVDEVRLLDDVFEKIGMTIGKGSDAAA